MFKRAATTAIAVFASLATATAAFSDNRSLADVPDPELHELLGDAVQVADAMTRDPDVARLLSRAEGIFLIPNYGGDEIVHGIRGGHAVALARSDGEWGHPVFFNMGAISVTAEADVEAGQLALILMSPDAIDFFKEDRSQRVNTDREQPGLVIATTRTWEQSGEADAVLWSATDHTFEGDIINLVDVVDNKKANAGYYGAAIEPAQIFAGDVQHAPDNVIGDALP